LLRFFGLVKAKYRASGATLNILAKYCGYNSSAEMLLVADKKYYNSLREEDLWRAAFFSNPFKGITVKGGQNDTFLH